MLVDVVSILACFVVIAESLYLHAVQTILLVNDEVEITHEIGGEIIFRHLEEQLVLVYRIGNVGEHEDERAKIYWESLPEGYEGKRFYHISTDAVYGALQMTHPEGIPAPFTTKASSDKNHEAYGEEFFLETTKYNPHSPYSASKASSDHFVRAFHDTYGMPTIVTNCSNNYGPYQFPEKLIPLFINNIRHRKPLPVYGKGENVRDGLYVVDHARAIDMIFHKGKIAETYNIGGFNEWKNIDIIKVVIKTVDRLLGRPEGADLDLITYVTDRKGHDMRYAIDSRKLQKELGWEPSLQFEEGIEETVKWYLENQEWMDNVTSGDYQKYYDNMYSNR